MFFSCARCGDLKPKEIQTELVIFSNGTKHIKANCLCCGQFLKFLPGEPGDFTMPFGKHKGKTFNEISRIDFNYLVWMAKEFGNEKFKKKAIEFLDSLK